MKSIFRGMGRNLLASLLGVVLLIGNAFAQSVPQFLGPNAYAAGVNVVAIAVGDLNSDGIADIVTANHDDHSVSLLVGNRNGTFQSAQNVQISAAPNSLVIGDFNSDGKQDIALVSDNGVLSILLGNGDGTLRPSIETTVDTGAFSIATGDMNGDGKADLVIGISNQAAILLGHGDGTFALSTVPVPSSATPDAVLCVVLADLNNDGHLDLITQVREQVTVFLGNGDGTFLQSQARVGASPGPMAIGDFNGDGKLDLVVDSIPQRVVDGSDVLIFPGNGDGTFGVFPFVIGIGSLIGKPVVADFDGDGKLDVAVKSQSSSAITLLLGNGDGAVRSLFSVETGNFFSKDLAAADFDQNGSIDLAVANLNANNVLVLRNTSGNPPLLSSVALNPASVAGGLETSQGTVTLGGAAPQGGAAITLNSSNSSLVTFPDGPSLTIPAGSSSANFSIATAHVTAATNITISAAWNEVTQSAVLSLVPPFNLVSLTVNPGSQVGTGNAVGMVTLSGPANASAVVALTSSNPAAVVPASVLVPAGATSVSFPVSLHLVAVNTPVTLSASLNGITRTAVLTVLAALDSVRITKAEFDTRKLSLKVEATSSNATAALTVLDGATGQLLGAMTNNGGGRYSLQVIVAHVTSIVVRSNLGGTASGPVGQK